MKYYTGGDGGLGGHNIKLVWVEVYSNNYDDNVEFVRVTMLDTNGPPEVYNNFFIQLTMIFFKTFSCGSERQYHMKPKIICDQSPRRKNLPICDQLGTVYCVTVPITV